MLQFCWQPFVVYFKTLDAAWLRAKFYCWGASTIPFHTWLCRNWVKIGQKKMDQLCFLCLKECSNQCDHCKTPFCSKEHLQIHRPHESCFPFKIQQNETVKLSDTLDNQRLLNGLDSVRLVALWWPRGILSLWSWSWKSLRLSWVRIMTLCQSAWSVWVESMAPSSVRTVRCPFVALTVMNKGSFIVRMSARS